MHFQEAWEKALKQTEIIRPRVQPLSTYSATYLPYIFLAESSVNLGDTVVRKGEVLVEKPGILLPSNLPQFEGFENNEQDKFEPDSFLNFLLVRGIRFPSLKYNNKTHSLDLKEGKLKAALEEYRRELEHCENTSTGLILGPEDCWQFSVIIFTCSQILKSAEGDIKKLLDDFHN